MNKLLALGAALSALAAASPAMATQTFSLSNVAFNDGTAITGTFQTDDTLTSVTSFNLTTRAGSLLFAGQTYSSAGPGASAQFSSGALTFYQTNQIFASFLTLNLAAPLTATGASVTGGTEGNFPFTRTVANGGSINPGDAAAAVPEPATWAMMIAGVGMAGAAMRRRQRVRFSFG